MPRHLKAYVDAAMACGITLFLFAGCQNGGGLVTDLDGAHKGDKPFVNKSKRLNVKGMSYTLPEGWISDHTDGASQVSMSKIKAGNWHRITGDFKPDNKMDYQQFKADRIKFYIAQSPQAQPQVTKEDTFAFNGKRAKWVEIQEPKSEELQIYVYAPISGEPTEAGPVWIYSLTTRADTAEEYRKVFGAFIESITLETTG